MTNTNNEAGFSYLELTISAAIILTLTALAIPPLTAAADHINNQIKTAEAYNQTIESYNP